MTETPFTADPYSTASRSRREIVWQAAALLAATLLAYLPVLDAGLVGEACVDVGVYDDI